MACALRPKDLRDAIEEVIKGRVEVVTLDKISLLSKTVDDRWVARNNLRNGSFPNATHTNKGDVQFSEDGVDHFLDEVIPPEEQLRWNWREFRNWEVVYPVNLLQLLKLFVSGCEAYDGAFGIFWTRRLWMSLTSFLISSTVLLTKKWRCDCRIEITR